MAAEEPPIDQITATLRAAIAGAISDAQGELTAIAEAGGKAASGGLTGDIQRLIGILDFATGILGGLFGDLNPAVKAVEDVAGAGGILGTGFGAGYLLGYGVYQVIQPLLLPLIHSANAALTNEIFDATTAAELVSKGIMHDDLGRNEAAGSGFDTPHFEQLVSLSQRRPEVEQLFELYRRQAITSTDFSDGLKRLGFPPFWIDRLPELIRQLLTPADLAIAVIKGRMNIDQAKGYAGTLGMLAPDFQTLVDTTGDAPGPEQLMEALRRDIIKDEEFVHGILEGRLRDEWVPMMRALRFSPMSLADVVRARVENYINDEQGLQLALQNGLKAEHYPILVESWGRPLAHMEMASLVHRGLATRDQFDQAIRESDIKDKYLDQSFQVAQRLIPERTLVSALAHGAITHDEATTRLKWLGFSDADAAILIQLGSHQRASTHHALTRTDITALYEDGRLPRKDAHDRLTSLGYSDADANAILDIADLRARATALRATERSIETSLRAHHLTQQQAKDQLISAGVTPEQAQSLTDRWLEQRGRATRTLSEAQIIRIASRGLLGADDARTRLIGLGLADTDAQLLLESYGIGLPTPATIAGPPASPGA